MSEKKGIHSHGDGEPCQCESLKEQIQSIKDKALEDCKSRNEQAKEQSEKLQSKMTKMLIASTVAFTVIGQDAVEKLEPFIAKITALLDGDTSALVAPAEGSGSGAGGNEPKTGSNDFKLDLKPRTRPTLPPTKSEQPVSVAQLLHALELLDGKSNVFSSVYGGNSTSSSFSVIDLPPSDKLNPEPVQFDGTMPWLAPEPPPQLAATDLLEAMPNSEQAPPVALSNTFPVEPNTSTGFPNFQFNTIPSAPSSTVLLAGIFQTRKR